MSPLKRPASYEDIRALPEHLVGELIDDELFVSPRPRARHARAASALGMELGGPFDRGRNGPGGWWILDEPELHLGRAVLVPDLAGWRRERMPEMPDVPFFTLEPDWVCEVLSPSTAKLDLQLKLPKYGSAGVAHAWIIDPVLRTLEVFRRVGAAWQLEDAFADGETVRATPFDAVPLELAALWLPPAPER
jgi:Uma2 family endonuclease